MKLLVLALASLAVPGSAYVTDHQVGDPSSYYVNVEFSDDGKYATFLEGKLSSGSVRYAGWLSRVDAASGDLIPADGRGFSMGDAEMVGMPQFGLDSAGPYSTLLDPLGRLVVIRPNGASAPTIAAVDDGASLATRLSRAFPYPSHNRNSPLQYVTYQVRGSTMTQQILVEITKNPATPILLHQEAVSPLRQAALIVDFARWLDDSFTLTHGAYKVGCLGGASLCPAQIKQATVSGGSFESAYVTFDSHTKVDAYPYAAPDGTPSLAAGLDLTADGGVYAYDAVLKQYAPRSTVSFRRSQTDLVLAGGAQSFQPFSWKGDSYAVYEVVETSGAVAGAVASSYPGEIWVAKLGATPVACRVSLREYVGDPFNPGKRARVDAEPLLYNGGENVALYYHSSPPIPKGAPMLPDLRRIDLGDKASFDADCAAGAAAALDELAPSVSIASPGSGATVSGVVSLSGAASDNVGVANVKISVDGGPFVLASGTASWTFSLNAAALSDGAHGVVARAADAIGNRAQASLALNVIHPTFSLYPSSTVVGLGGTQSMGAAFDADGPGGAQLPQYLAGSSVTWTTSNSFVAGVDVNGMVLGKRRGTAVITATYGAFSASATIKVAGTSTSYSLTTPDGRARTYLLYVPDSYAGAKTPLVISLHGGSGTNTGHVSSSQWLPVADQNGFLAAFPQGVVGLGGSSSWNNGGGDKYATRQQIDDVGFISKMIDDIGTKAAVDPARVYAAGISNGGSMSHRLACQLSSRIAAIAPVAAGIEEGGDFTSCVPGRPIPIMEFHGMTDRNYPFYGGQTSDSASGNSHYPIPQTISDWLGRDGLAGSTATITYRHGIETCRTYAGGGSVASVTLCVADPAIPVYADGIVYDGGGHAWPGGTKNPFGADLDVPTPDIGASASAWAFFKTLTLDTTPPAVAILSPANGAMAFGTVVLSGTASDNSGLASVAVSVDGGTFVVAAGSVAWTYALNATALSDGPHGVVVKAADAAGNFAQASITLTVTHPTFSIFPSATVVGAGGTQAMGAVFDADGSGAQLPQYLAGSLVTWSSANMLIATVDANGSVSGKRSGTAVITASYNGLTSSATVRVAGASTSYSFTTPDGRSRNYILYVPDSYVAGRPAPMVIDMHGGGGSADGEASVSQLVPVAEQNGFLVAFPNGSGSLIGNTWNGGNCCGSAMTKKIDDVKFISMLIDDVAAKASLDLSRVYATGMSNGGIMSHRLACELSTRIAAIAPMSGGLNLGGDFLACAPGRPMPIMEFHGTTDANYPYNGGVGADSAAGTDFYPIPRTISDWLERNRMAANSKAITYRKGIETCETYSASGTAATVTLCTANPPTPVSADGVVYDGGGHAEPGGIKNPVSPNGDVPTQDLSAAAAMWSFFKTVTLDTTPPALKLSSLADGATAFGLVSLTGTASDNVSVASVTVAVDGGAFVLATGTAAWSAKLDTRALADGPHRLLARAVDASGNFAEVSVGFVSANTAAAPAGLGIVARSSGALAVSWSANGNLPGTIYSAELSTNAFATVSASSRTSAVTASFSGLTSNATYFLRAQAFAFSGAPSNYTATLATATPAAAPAAAPIAGVAVSSLTANWLSGGNSAGTLYTVRLSTVDLAGTGVSLSTRGLSAYVSGLSASTTYWLSVRAEGFDGKPSAFTPLGSTVTWPAPWDPVRAAIVTPASGRRIRGNRVSIVADLAAGAPRQVSKVVFQFRGGSDGAWLDARAAGVNHPNPDVDAPYFIQWDADAMGPGTYQLRAVAYDAQGRPDPAPAVVNITVVTYFLPYDISESLQVDGKILQTQIVDARASSRVTGSGAGHDDPVATVSLPAGAVAASTVTVSLVSNPVIPATAAPAGMTFVGSAVQVDLSNGQHQLDGAATITLSYPEGASLAGGLRIMSYDPAAGAWTAIGPATVDTALRTVTASTPHFSLFAVVAGGGVQADLSGVRAYPVPYKPNGADANEGRPYSPGDPNSGIVFDRLPGQATVKIYTLSGRLVARFDAPSGTGSVQWDARHGDGRDAASGAYFAVVAAPGHKSVVKKLLILR